MGIATLLCISGAVTTTQQPQSLNVSQKLSVATGYQAGCAQTEEERTLELPFSCYNILSSIPGTGSFVTGCRVHNSWIERLWHDVFSGCLFLFYSIFQYLESVCLLDVEDEVHLFCLHYVYLPEDVSTSLELSSYAV